MPVCVPSLASLEEEVKPVGSKRRREDLLVANSSFKKVKMEEVKVEEIKTEDETVDSCVLCDKVILQPGTSLRFHYAREHYFPEGAFLAFYSEGALTCPFQPCTERLM